MKKVFVTGAAGFLGSHLVAALLERGCQVRALVRNTPLELEHPNLEQVKGDVRDVESLIRGCKGVDTVFHTAAFMGFMGGTAVSPEYRAQAYAGNVGGAENVLAACRENGVKRLVHTSSVDVCFNYVEDLHMGEHTPYASDADSMYTVTKIAAEKTILAANSDQLHTCALRPDAIWGAGKCVMFEAVLNNLRSGMLIVRFGGMGAMHDHVHVDNLVHAHLLAAEAMSRGSPVCGRAYFVSDGQPQALFAFLRPFIEGLGYKFPRFSVPAWPIRAVMKAWEWAHFKFGIVEPPITPHEVNKSVISHVVSSIAAKRDFGYEPVKTVEQGMQEVLEYHRARGNVRS